VLEGNQVEELENSGQLVELSWRITKGPICMNVGTFNWIEGTLS
jgi:hypothetical protein